MADQPEGVAPRDLFALIRRTDRGLVWLNILLAFLVARVAPGVSLLIYAAQALTA